MGYSLIANATTINDLSIPAPAYVDATDYVAYKKIPRVRDYNPCSCVSYAKWVAGISQSESWGNAWNIKPNSTTPSPEGFVLTYDGKGHIAHYVLKGDILILDEANFESCRVTTGRQLDMDSKVIRGFLN